MKTEHDVTLPVLTVLSEEPSGQLATGELRHKVRERLPLDQQDLWPLNNRSDQRIDQIIRNLKSHKATPGNPFCEGLLQDVPRGYAITDRGRAYLLSRLGWQKGD